MGGETCLDSLKGLGYRATFFSRTQLIAHSQRLLPMKLLFLIRSSFLPRLSRMGMRAVFINDNTLNDEWRRSAISENAIIRYTNARIVIFQHPLEASPGSSLMIQFDDFPL